MASPHGGTGSSADRASSLGVEATEDQHMTGLETLMWALESDPQLSSAFANLTVFDRAPVRATFRARMEDATRAVPRLRERVVVGRNPLEHPEWVEDPDFDLDHHLRWVDLGGDAVDAELHDLAARLAAQPFDLERPLWEFVTIEGLRGGRRRDVAADAPHDHRRRGRHPALGRVPRPRTRPRPPGAATVGEATRRPTRSGACDFAGRRRRRGPPVVATPTRVRGRCR